MIDYKFKKFHSMTTEKEIAKGGFGKKVKLIKLSEIMHDERSSKINEILS